MPCQMAAVTSESRNLLLGIFLFQVPEPAQTLPCLSKAAALLPSLAPGQVVLALPTGFFFFGGELRKSFLRSSDHAEMGKQREVKSAPYSPKCGPLERPISPHRRPSVQADF